jgi:imidazolonepropionase-like amidohydrolase
LSVLALLAIAALAQDTPIALCAGRLLDVRSGEVRERVVVLVRGERIESIAPAASCSLPVDTRVVDLSNATVLPGLIDVHVHLAWGPAQPGASELPGASEAAATLRAGFTTVRNLGSTGGADIALRAAIERGEVLGPRMLAAGAALGVEGGTCDSVRARPTPRRARCRSSGCAQSSRPPTRAACASRRTPKALRRSATRC